VSPAVDRVEIPDLVDSTALRRAFQGASTVVHLAGRVHRMRGKGSEALAEFRRVNVEGTRAVIEAAAAAQVRTCVVASSIKAVGDRNAATWTESTTPAPADPYGVSKLESERTALEHGRRSGVEVVVVRLPLVYGPGALGNALRLLRLVDRGVPLPLAGIRNRRSMLFTGNLISAVRAIFEAPRLGGEVFFLADGVDLSTPELVRTIAKALGKPARLWSLPVIVLRLAGALTGMSDEIARLVDSLSISPLKFERATGWRPPFSPSQGWKATAEWYRETLS